MAQLSHPYMSTGETIAWTIWTFVSKVMSLLFKMLFRFVMVEEYKINIFKGLLSARLSKALSSPWFHLVVFLFAFLNNDGI